MYVIARKRHLYFNRRINGRILRLSLHTQDPWLAQQRAVQLYTLISRWQRDSMDYNTIKLRAKEQAQAMHDEWLSEHFTGLHVTDEEIEFTRYEEDSEDDYASDLTRKLILGELLPDEIEDSLAFILYKQLQRCTFEEWRDPKNCWLSLTTPPSKPLRYQRHTSPMVFMTSCQTNKPPSPSLRTPCKRTRTAFNSSLM